MEVTMRKRHVERAAMAGLCLLFVVLAYAGPKNFWELKPYTEWTASEVDKILQKASPWTQVLLLLPTGGGGGGRSSARDPNPSYSTPVYITWNSRIVRQAVARKTMLESPDTPRPEIEKVLNYDPKHIEIFVNGPVMGGGRGAGQAAGAAEFKENTYLQKKNKEKIPLADLVTTRGRNGSITLLFPREVDGKPTVVPEDKEITLVIRVGENNYKFAFKYAAMMVDGKMEM
jgi:hypothetical protein